MNLDVNVVIVVGFLICNLIFGIFSGRGINTIQSYVIGDRRFNTATLVSTIVATWVSGEFFISVIAETYKEGMAFMIIPLLADFLGLILVGLFFVPRMAEFLGKLSVAESMGDLYGKNIRTITAISGFIGVSGIIAVQLKIAGFLFEYALGTPTVYGIILS